MKSNQAKDNMSNQGPCLDASTATREAKREGELRQMRLFWLLAKVSCEWTRTDETTNDA